MMYYARGVDNKLLMTISSIGTQQDTATEGTVAAIRQLLNYVATYPNNGIIYRTSDMILCARSNAAYLNESKSRSQAGSFIFLSEDNAIPRLNGPVLVLAQIIKFFMSSFAESELAGVFITAKKMIPFCQTLIEMAWPQPKLPIQTDNSTTDGVTNRTSIAKKIKSMYMRLWWLQCRESQGQFRIYWASGSRNKSYCPTKHHPKIYHETKC